MISRKTSQEIRTMTEGGKILAKVLAELVKAVRPGITTRSLDKLARELILFYGVKPAFLGYGDFPAVLCTSVNDEVVHGVPSERILVQGDLIGLDFGIVHGGFHTDSAVTVPVLGNKTFAEWQKADKRKARLLEVTRKSLEIGISKAKAGRRLGEISHAIQQHIEDSGFGVVRDLVGHGIGQKLHEEPHVPNYGDKDAGVLLEEGMTIAVEPMVTMGDWRVGLAKDNFTFKTLDGSWAAHFEHTILVTKTQPVVLTRLVDKL